MKVYKVSLGETAYILRGSFETKLARNTEYVILANLEQTAKALLKEFIGDSYTYNIPRAQNADIRRLEDALENLGGESRYRSIARLIESTEPYLGSIKVDGALVIVADFEPIQFVLKCHEGSKERVILETLQVKGNNKFSIGIERQADTIASLSQLIQSKFP